MKAGAEVPHPRPRAPGSRWGRNGGWGERRGFPCAGGRAAPAPSPPGQRPGSQRSSGARGRALPARGGGESAAGKFRDAARRPGRGAWAGAGVPRRRHLRVLLGEAVGGGAGGGDQRQQQQPGHEQQQRARGGAAGPGERGRRAGPGGAAGPSRQRHVSMHGARRQGAGGGAAAPRLLRRLLRAASAGCAGTSPPHGLRALCAPGRDRRSNSGRRRPAGAAYSRARRRAGPPPRAPAAAARSAPAPPARAAERAEPGAGSRCAPGAHASDPRLLSAAPPPSLAHV